MRSAEFWTTVIEQTYNFLAAHKSTLVIGFGWFIREVPVVWNSLQDNGGVIGLWKRILNGKTENETTPATAQPKV